MMIVDVYSDYDDSLVMMIDDDGRYDYDSLVMMVEILMIVE